MKIFLLSCGTTACFNFCKTVKTKGISDVHLIGVDINPVELVATKNYLDEFYTVPPSSSNEYYKYILNLLDLTKPDFIIPSFDIDQHLFYDGAEDLKNRGIRSLGIPKETLAFYRNKRTMSDLMQKNGIPTPKIFENKVESISKYFAKPLNGVASVGAQKISYYQFDHFIADGYLIQEICKEPEITVQCFRSGNFFRCICRERIQTKGGVCSKARIFHDSSLSKIAEEFSDLIKTPILFNLQFMKDNNNNWVITDVNLRMAGGGYLSNAVGWDETSALLSLLKTGKTDGLTNYLPIAKGETYVIATTAWEITKSCDRA